MHEKITIIRYKIALFHLSGSRLNEYNTILKTHHRCVETENVIVYLCLLGDIWAGADQGQQLAVAVGFKQGQHEVLPMA